MNHMRAFVVVCLVLAAPAWSSQPPLADKLPAGTVVYLGWAGRSLTFNGSMFGQLLGDPAVEGLFSSARSALRAQCEGNKEDQAVLDELWEMGRIAWRHPCVVGLFDLLAAGPAGKAPSAGRPVGALLVDLQKDRPGFERHFQAMLASARRRVKITQAAVGKVPYYRFQSPSGPCAMGFVGQVFFMALGEKAPETVVALAGGKARSLAQDARFAAAMKEVCGECVQWAFYIDFARAYELADRLGQRPGLPPATTPARAGGLRRPAAALGLERLTAVAGAGSIVDRLLHTKVRLLSPPEHRGLLMPLAGEPLLPTALAAVPADAEFVLSLRLKPAALFAELRKALAGLAGPAAKDGDPLVKIERDLGIDIGKDLLSHLAEQWTLMSAPSLGGSASGTVLLGAVKEGHIEAFKASLARLERALDKRLGQGGSVGRLGRGLRVRRLKAGELEVHYIAAAGKAPAWALAPAWAVHKGRFYLAGFPQVVVAAATGPAGKPLVEDPEFIALRKRLAPTPSVLMYVNTPQLLRRYYGLILAGWTAGANRSAGRLGPFFSPATLPPLPRLTPHLRGDIYAVSHDAKGITVEAVGSVPGGGLLFVNLPTLAVAAAGRIPWLDRAAVLARRAASAENLKLIGQACQRYAADNKGQFPPDLAVLVQQYALPAKALNCPGGPAGGLFGWSSRRVGATKYEYLGALMTTATPKDMILAHEEPEANASQGANVLYVDGRVRWLPTAEFNAQVARTRSYLKSQGK